jgi:SAM-dependent methyltransferase
MDTASRIAANHAIWQRWTALHVPSDFYDVEGFIADPDARPYDGIVAGLLGSDLSGQRALHLQCHFGMDTLRLVRLGAEATGLDFSSVAIEAARDLSARSGIPATFIEGNVLKPPAELPENAFDLVFTSWGVISWLPDLEPWAYTIASRLAPGGVFKIAEMHPTLWIFDDEAQDPELRIKCSYFGRDALEWEERGSTRRGWWSARTASSACPTTCRSSRSPSRSRRTSRWGSRCHCTLMSESVGAYASVSSGTSLTATGAV